MWRLRWLVAALLLGMMTGPALATPTPQVLLDDTYGFLSFWNAHQGERLFGPPLTAPIEEAGRIVQYFERARFEYIADQEPAVMLGLLGRERTRWRSFPVTAPAGSAAVQFDSTSYVIQTPFRQFWEEQGGVDIFGLPISNAFWEQSANGRFQIQYFERTLLIHHPLYAGTAEEFEIAALGRELAAARSYIEGVSVQMTPAMFAYDPIAPAPVVTVAPETEVAASQAAPVEESAPAAAPPARSQPAAAAPAKTPAAPAKPQPSRTAGQRIIVDISEQWLYAYEGDSQVFKAPVATGKDGFNTPSGSFRIYAKTPLQTMRGSLNGETWLVPNVPHAMYYSGSMALHGTYWHNLFGSGVRISHGCVNLPLDAAAWLYGWASIGTSVTVQP